MVKTEVLRLYEHYKKIGYTAAQKDIELKRPWVLDSNAEDTAKIDFKDETAKKVSRAKAIPKVAVEQA